MFRQPNASKLSSSSGGVTTHSHGKQQTPTSGNRNGQTSPTTIREIRSRTVANNRNLLLANRRQAVSMEKLNSNGNTSELSSSSASNNNINCTIGVGDKGKNSPSSGSSNSISSSNTSSPQRTGGLNRTASRVSRFRSAKAVFERLSSTSQNNNSTNKLDRAGGAPEKPRGTVASRYAAAASARVSNSHAPTASNSPRSRYAISTLSNKQSIESLKSNLNSNSQLPKTDSTSTGSSINSSNSNGGQPKPQPRVITNRQQANMNNTNGSGKNKSTTTTATTTANNNHTPNGTPVSKPTTQAKPPTQDLIDKIVLEIAGDAAKQKPDPDCSIQDLSSCDISGIPETLDFDRCFQDVEMMTEEEARKLLSKKHDMSNPTIQVNNGTSIIPNASNTTTSITTNSTNDQETLLLGAISDNSTALKGDDDTDVAKNLVNESSVGANLQLETDDLENRDPLEKQPRQTLHNITDLPTPINHEANVICSVVGSEPELGSSSSRTKVRFSEEEAKIYDTYAVDDYDRRNKDIDPVAASAEYELEKSQEREGIRADEEEDDDDVLVVITESTIGCSNQTLSQTTSSDKLPKQNHPIGVSVDDEGNNTANNHNHHDDHDDDDENTKEYIESLERELGLKRILEQNLRDLQSQYYEAVKELDDYKSSNESRIVELEKNIDGLNGKLENSKIELADSIDKANQSMKELNDIKESSQILEKKYHRAKRIIKDMQSREQSFNRREQLYQQKLDEIEYELGVLTESIFKTIYGDSINFYEIIDNHSSSSSISSSNANLSNYNSATKLQFRIKSDVFGLIRKILKNFTENKSTQNPQIKQRVVSILEQQFANLMISTNNTQHNPLAGINGNAIVVQPITTGTSNPSSSLLTASSSNEINNNSNAAEQIQSINSKQSHEQSNHNNPTSYQLANHRLSQPNLPHPIGVSGQPTKIFHGLNPTPVSITSATNNSQDQSSSPPSVNSYPSTNSLNSLNINNNNLTTTNNNNSKLFPSKGQLGNDAYSSSTNILNSITSGPSNPIMDDKFHIIPDVQASYQTNEWHDKPVCEWTTTQVSTWLLALGLDQYISKFEDRNVNGQSLINLDSTVLKGLGVLNSNDRNLLKKKIRELRVEMEKERKLFEKKIKENLKDKYKYKCK